MEVHTTPPVAFKAACPSPDRMSKVRTILCAADPGGSESAVETLTAAAESREVDAIALVGDLSAGAAAAGYRSLFHALATSGRPAYWVPGPQDAPLDAYFRAAHAIEATHPQLRGVHGSAALTPDGHLTVAGVGGEIDDLPESTRDEAERLRYPRLEAEYRLRVLETFDEHDCVLLFWSQPAHRTQNPAGSDTVAELINTHRPRLVVCGGERGTETLGKRSVVVAPGSLREGYYAVVDLQTREVELAEPDPARSA
jgi:Icc-related predicted phosphoesterase